MDSIIEKHPSWKLLSKLKLVKKVRDEYDIPVKDISDWYDAQEISQIYKPTEAKTKNKLQITAAPYSFQIDVVKYPRYKKYNNNVDSFLLLVDITSRKAFAYVLKNGTMSQTLDKYEEFINDVGHQVFTVSGDDFFHNDEFIAYNDELGIRVYTSVADEDHLSNKGNVLGIVDRLVRTLKSNMEKYMMQNETLKWSEFLGEIIKTYNDTPHSGIKNNTPNEVYDDEDFAKAINDAKANENTKEFKKVDLDVGDKVRAMLGKKTFEKEKQKFSTELYTIIDIVGYKFQLTDEDGKVLKRLYRPIELQKVKNVSNRVNTQQIQKAHKSHTTARKLNSLMTYDDAQKSIQQTTQKPTKATRSGRKY